MLYVHVGILRVAAYNEQNRPSLPNLVVCSENEYICLALYFPCVHKYALFLSRISVSTWMVLRKKCFVLEDGVIRSMH